MQKVKYLEEREKGSRYCGVEILQLLLVSFIDFIFVIFLHILLNVAENSRFFCLIVFFLSQLNREVDQFSSR